MLSRDEFIKHPSISASKIKKFYLGEFKGSPIALQKGIDFHTSLLETEPEQMNKEATNVYRCIQENPLSAMLFNDAQKEFAILKEIDTINNFGAFTINAKALYDIYKPQANLIADIKTTSASNIEQFQKDMISHCNHIQAVWYSLIAGIDPSNFYYIGVPAAAKKSESGAHSIYVTRHTPDEIKTAQDMINNFFSKEWRYLDKYIKKKE